MRRLKKSIRTLVVTLCSYEVSQNFNDFDRSDVKMIVTFQRKLRKFAEDIRNVSESLSDKSG